MRRACAIAVLAGVLAGCGGGQDERVLRLVTADPLGAAHDPGAVDFAARVAAVSGGRLRVVIDERPSPDGSAHETSLILDVARGRADFGWAHASTFDRLGVRSLVALSVPMLVDGDALQDAVLRSPLGEQMLAGLARAGVQGLALLAGPPSRLLGVGAPVLRLDDLRRHIVATPESATAERALRAVRAYPRRTHTGRLRVLYEDVRRLGAHAAIEDDADALFFQRAPCAPPEPSCPAGQTWVTANVALWPRTAVIFANPRRLGALDGRERRWVVVAAAQAAARAASTHSDDAAALAELCAGGVHVATAQPGAVAELRRAWRPFLRRLERRPDTRRAVRQIERLRAQHPAGPAPGGCESRRIGRAMRDGVYRTQITSGDLRAAGTDDPPDRAGTATLTLRRGRWRLVLTEPGRVVRTGTYAGSALRTTWTTDGSPADIAYVSVATDHDGALRYRIGAATNRASAQATLASHPWRRIGP